MKKLFLSILIAVMMLTAASVTSFSENGNGDGDYTISDVLYILKHLAKLVEFDKSDNVEYDIDGNGVISINDALEILKALAKLIPMPPRPTVDTGEYDIFCMNCATMINPIFEEEKVALELGLCLKCYNKLQTSATATTTSGTTAVGSSGSPSPTSVTTTSATATTTSGTTAVGSSGSPSPTSMTTTSATTTSATTTSATTTSTTTSSTATTSATTTTTSATTTAATLPIVPLSDFEYVIRSGVAEIVAYKGNSADAVVPSVIERNPVAVRPTAFTAASGLKTVTFLDESPATYIAYRAAVAAVQFKPSEYVPSTTTQRFSHMETDYGNLILPGAFIGGVWREPQYGVRPVYVTETVPGYWTQEVQAKDAVPASAAKGMSPDMFGELSGFTIYVPENKLTDYKLLFSGKNYTILPVDVKDGILSISVKKPPAKTDYIESQKLDTSGIVVEARFSDGTVKEVAGGFTVSETVLNKVGTVRVFVTYEGKVSWFDVEVIEDKVVGIEVLTLPKKLKYFEGDEFDETGLTLTATRLSGNTEVITNGFTCGVGEWSKYWSNSKFNEGGKQKVYAEYEEIVVYFDVDVTWLAVVSMTVLGEKEHTSGSLNKDQFYGYSVYADVEIVYNNGDVKKSFELIGEVFIGDWIAGQHTKEFSLVYTVTLNSGVKYDSEPYEFTVTWYTLSY